MTQWRRLCKKPNHHFSESVGSDSSLETYHARLKFKEMISNSHINNNKVILIRVEDNYTDAFINLNKIH